MSSVSTRLSLRPSRHFTVDDALGQAFHDGGLADARLTDEHGVVLVRRLQHLDGAADLIIAADDRVELAGLGTGREVDGVFSSAWRWSFRVPASVHGLAAAHLLYRFLEGGLGKRRRRARHPPAGPWSPGPASTKSSEEMNWSWRFCASLSVRLRMRVRSWETCTSPLWLATLGVRSSWASRALRKRLRLAPTLASSGRTAAAFLVQEGET